MKDVDNIEKREERQGKIIRNDIKWTTRNITAEN